MGIETEIEIKNIIFKKKLNRHMNPETSNVPTDANVIF